MAGFFSPGIAPAAHGARVFVPGKPARLATGRARPPALRPGRLGRGPRTVPPGPGGRGPRAPARALVAAACVAWCTVRAACAWCSWPRFAGRVCVCDPWPPVFVILGYKHPGPRRLVRDPRALVRAAWCMRGQVRPARRGPRSLGRGPWTWWPVPRIMRPAA